MVGGRVVCMTPPNIGSPLSDRATLINLLLYGPEGTGKTTAALRMTKLCKGSQKVLLVDAEAGAKREALAQRGVDVKRVEIWPDNPTQLTYDGMTDVAAELMEAGSQHYVGCVLDSYSEVSRLLLDSVTAEARLRDAAIGKKRQRFAINLEDYGVASSMLRDLLRKFRDLPMHMVITALERRDIDDNGAVKYGPAMSPAVATDTLGLVDIVGYTSIEQVGGDAGELVRSAHFTPVSRRRAKDRFGMLPAKLADPYADRIIQYVEGTLTAANDPVQAHVREVAKRGQAPASTADKKKEKVNA